MLEKWGEATGESADSLVYNYSEHIRESGLYGVSYASTLANSSVTVYFGDDDRLTGFSMENQVATPWAADNDRQPRPFWCMSGRPGLIRP